MPTFTRSLSRRILVKAFQIVTKMMKRKFWRDVQKLMMKMKVKMVFLYLMGIFRKMR